MRRGRAVAGVFISLALSAPASPAETRHLDDAQKRTAISDLGRALRARYVLADVAESAARFLETKLAQGGYGAADAEAFAEAVTLDLQRVTGDRHLRFGVSPPPPPAGTAAPPPTAEQRTSAAAARLDAIRRGNNGLPRAEVLAGNVGYLEVRRFQPPEIAGDTLVAAMAFLAGADAIIVDVRNCRGGSAFMMPLFAGYFFSRPTHLFDMTFRADAVTESYWTLPYVPGKRLAEIPMYILTSAYTFSGAEGFAYRFQVLERATIVGERTAGGANAGGPQDIAPFFRVYMPTGRPVDRDTKTNWESTGVLPDLAVPARDALRAAHAEAIRTLRGRAEADAERARLDGVLQRLEADRDDGRPAAGDLERYAGTYATRRVWVEGGQLRFAGEETPTFLLTPLGDGVFTADADESLRVEFVRGSGTDVERMVITSLDGDRWEYPKAR